MAKKTKERLYIEARELYINTDLSIADISKQLEINVNTLYKKSTTENWALLKESAINELINDKNIMLNDRKLKSIEFYENVMDKCVELLPETMSGKELKCITETHIMAENRLFLLSKSKLEEEVKEKEESNGILDELAKM